MRSDVQSVRGRPVHSVLVAAGTSGILLIGILVCLESGYRLGRRSQATCEHPYEGVGAIDAAVFGLLALLLGFSFAVGMSRLEYRRELAVKEADAIGTAYMRLDLLPADTQPKLRRLFREYLDARLSVYRNLSDFDLAEREIARADQIQDKIWSAAVEGSESDLGRKSVRILLLPAINEMIDIATPRTVELRMRLPRLILGLLIGVALLSGLLAGYAVSKRGKRSYLHMLIYAGAIVLTVYTIMDLENPRSGLIRLENPQTVVDRLQQMIR